MTIYYCFSSYLYLHERKTVTTPHGSSRGLLGRSQRLLPQSQNVQTRVIVAVQDDATTGTDRGAVREGERLPRPTLRAVLTRVRRVPSDILPTGPCCLVGEEGGELA